MNDLTDVGVAEHQDGALGFPAAGRIVGRTRGKRRIRSRGQFDDFFNQNVNRGIVVRAAAQLALRFFGLLAPVVFARAVSGGCFLFAFSDFPQAGVDCL
jgi:hypothetical protein